MSAPIDNNANTRTNLSKLPVKAAAEKVEENRLSQAIKALANSQEESRPTPTPPRPTPAPVSAEQVTQRLSQTRPSSSTRAVSPSGGSTWSFATPRRTSSSPTSADAAERLAEASSQEDAPLASSLNPTSADALERRAEASSQDDPTLASFLTPTSADAAERRAQSEGQSPQPGVPNAAVDAVEQALEEGGPEAAAAELREQAASLPPEGAAQLLQEVPEVVDAITGNLGDEAEARDHTGPRASELEDQKAFDQMVADLAAVAEQAAQAEAPAGEAALQMVTDSIVANIDPDEIGRFDEALGNAIASGSGARLSVAVVDTLARVGRTGQADDILQNVEDGTNQLRQNYDRVADKVDGFNAQLGRLISDWQGVLTPEELESATQAFRDSHPEYAQLEALAGPLVATADQLAQLPPDVQQLDHADDVQGANNKLIREQLVRVGQTSAGVAAMAQVQDGHISGQPGLLTHIEELSSSGQFSDDERESLASLGLSAATQRALEAESLEAAGDAWEVLNDLSATFGLSGEVMRELVGGLREVLESGGGSASAVDTALGEFSDQLEETGGLSPRLNHTLRGAGLLAGALATYGSVAAALEDPNFETVSRSLVDAADAGVEGVALIQSLRGFTSAGVKTAGNWLGGLGAALDVYSAVQSLADGDLPSAGLHAASAAGGIAILAGGAWTGPGIVLAIGATAALYQLGRVRASNVQENEHTEAFLAGAGVTDSGVTRHLRNADSEGRSVGPVLTALAEHLQIEPTELFDWISSLPPDEVIDFVEAMHGVDPDGEGNFPREAEIDAQVDPETRNGPLFTSPQTLNGLEIWLRVNGYELPG